MFGNIEKIIENDLFRIANPYIPTFGLQIRMDGTQLNNEQSSARHCELANNPEVVDLLTILDCSQARNDEIL
jgi:hypothetical protein